MNIFQEAITLLRHPKKNSKTLQARLFAFFALFAVIIIGVIFLLLNVAGILNSEQRHIGWIKAEAKRSQDAIINDYGRLSLHGVAFAKTLATNIDRWVQRNNIAEVAEGEFSKRDAQLLLSELVPNLLTMLDSNMSSGVFIILESSTSAKEGLFFKRTTTSSLSSISSKNYCLRGSIAIAKEHGIELLEQWQQDFYTDNSTFFIKVMEAARRNTRVDLSQLYYWSNRFIMDGNHEHAMMLVIPLIAKDGAVYGVCGIEISGLLFKRLYSPNSSRYPHLFSAIVPYGDNEMDTSKGLIAGDAYLSSKTTGILMKEDEQDGLTSLRSSSGERYIGVLQNAQLYPSRSVFRDEAWTEALLMPQADLDAVINQDNLVFYRVLAAILIISLLAALLISRRYIHPVVTALNLIKTDERTTLGKTKITEIDDLLEYLAATDEKYKSQTPTSATVNALFDQFIANLELLTPAERAVFNLYKENKSAQEVADALFVSINTIKFHNKNIYSKLGVPSLKTLKVYIDMMGK